MSIVGKTRSVLRVGNRTEMPFFRSRLYYKLYSAVRFNRKTLYGKNIVRAAVPVNREAPLSECNGLVRTTECCNGH